MNKLSHLILAEVGFKETPLLFISLEIRTGKEFTIMKNLFIKTNLPKNIEIPMLKIEYHNDINQIFFTKSFIPNLYRNIAKKEM